MKDMLFILCFTFVWVKKKKYLAVNNAIISWNYPVKTFLSYSFISSSYIETLLFRSINV